MSSARAHPPTVASQCEHLGIRDDARTCLAFPSTWNYCHRATPPASVRLEHQRQYCQSIEHMRCPVLQAERPGRLPAELRGRHASTHHRHRAGAQAAVVPILVLLATFAVGYAVLTGLWSRTFLPTRGGDSRGGPPIAADDPVGPTTVPPTAPPLVLPIVPAHTAISNGLAITQTYFDQSPSTPTPVFTPMGSCGHQIDEAFGTDTKLLIHRVGGWDSLNRYEIVYRTSVEAMVAVNYPFPIPLRPNRVLVIPLDVTDAEGLPIFEPIEVSNRNTAIQTMAFKVSADLLAFEKYNDFDQTCQNFFGWVVAPRERTTP